MKWYLITQLCDVLKWSWMLLDDIVWLFFK